MQAAHDAASEYTEFYRGGRQLTMAAPRIIGPGHCDEVTGTGRTVFLASFEDARVQAASSAFELRGELLFDYQGHEIDRIAVESHADEFVSDAGHVFALRPERNVPTLEIPEALSLVGSTARRFGHWIIEYLLRWATAGERSELKNVPVLIDERLPPSHRQALEYFSEGRAQIVVVPAEVTVQVGKLWTVANWIYVPIYWKNEQAIDVRFLVWPTIEVAERYRRLARRIDRELDEAAGPKRIFLARRETLHRKLMNIDSIQDIARAYGFQVCYPEDLDFREQVQLVRRSTHIMAPEGSALFLAVFARPGTRVCGFDHPFVEKAGFMATLFKELGIDAVLVTGECVRKDELFSRFSDYVIDEANLQIVLDDWKLAPSAKPIDRAPSLELGGL